MVRLAGKPILGHILTSLAETRIQEVAIIVGRAMQGQIIQYARSAFGDRFRFSFPEQETPEGLGHSIYQAQDVIGEAPVLITLGDMLFENGYRAFLESHDGFEDTHASLGVKPVEHPEHYGVVELTDDNRIERLVEKPDDPPSNHAISGVYVIEDTPSLFDALGYLIDSDIRGAGDEYQLTDALQRMIEEGSTLHAFEVEDWYDCGRPETLLEANRVLLSRVETNSAEHDRSVVLPPADFGDDVSVESSVIGPNVSIDDGAEIRESIVRDSIIGRGAVLEGVNIDGSIVGDNAQVHGEANHLNVGDNSQINL